MINIQPIKDFQQQLKILFLLKYLRPANQHNKNCRHSAISVVKAAASCFQIGINKKFIAIFTTALTAEATNTIFSLLCGTKIHCPQNHPNKLNNKAMLKIVKDVVACIYDSSETIHTISFRSKMIPVKHGITNEIKSIYTDSANFENEPSLFPASDARRGIDTIITEDKIVLITS